MRIPGEKRSPFPDDCGSRAGEFAEAVRDGEMDQAWSMLSKETRGMRMGVWATRNRIDMQEAYRAGYNSDHPLRSAMLAPPRCIVRLDCRWYYHRRTASTPTPHMRRLQCENGR